MKSSHGCGTVHKQLIRELKKKTFLDDARQPELSLFPF